MAVYEPGNRLSPDTKSAGFLILDAAASRTVRNKFLFFTCHLVHGILLNQQEPTDGFRFLNRY